MNKDTLSLSSWPSILFRFLFYEPFFGVSRFEIGDSKTRQTKRRYMRPIQKFQIEVPATKLQS